VEHARGTPRGEDMRRDLDRGYSIPSRRSGGGSRGDRFVSTVDVDDYRQTCVHVAHKDFI